jgi:hypothetical protein
MNEAVDVVRGSHSGDEREASANNKKNENLRVQVESEQIGTGASMCRS